LNKRLRVVVSLPNENAYQHEAALAAKAAGAKLGLDLSILLANDDSITQSQQLLEIIQSRSDAPPPPFSSNLSPPAAFAASPRLPSRRTLLVISNSDGRLRRGNSDKNSRVPIFIVTQGQFEIGRPRQAARVPPS